MRDRLHAYLGGIARENAMVAIAVGGVADHVHFGRIAFQMRVELPAPETPLSYPVYFRNSGAMQKHGSFPTADLDGLTERAER